MEYLKKYYEHYEKKKSYIRDRTKKRSKNRDLESADLYDPKLGAGRVDLACRGLQVGTKVIIGGGLGLLLGVASTAVAAGSAVVSAADLLVAASMPKICGLVGSVCGLKIGLRKNKKRVNNEACT